ncbi:MAG: radical SAM family heme chaperone HemW [Pirellulales bacterium]
MTERGTDLLAEIGDQSDIRSAYIHVPFCARRCGYCNFTVVAGRHDLVPRYLEALRSELALLGQPRPVDTLYFGGGTPTQLSLGELDQLFQIVLAWHPLTEGGELTIEANPNDLDRATVRLLAEHGVTRVSLGAQSFEARKLRMLERQHSADQIRRAVGRLRSHIEIVSLDLMFGVPGESVDDWSRDLDSALQLGPDHLSTYGLTIERGSAFFGRRQRGQIVPADDTVAREMYLLAIDRLVGRGWDHYEVSSFSLPGRRCRHNEVYWLGHPYYAAGPGAARYTEGCREVNHRSTSKYLQQVLGGHSPVAERERLASEDVARERLVFALRRLEGVDRDQFQRATRFSIEQLVGADLERLVTAGLLDDDRQRIKLSREGLLVSDAIWPSFLRV